MRPWSKRKVCAQRKYAQGAFIPPNNNINIAARTNLHASKTQDEEANVVYNNLSAKSLLDVVTFSNLHIHPQPVVLLERLLEKTAEVNTNVPSPSPEKVPKQPCSPEKKAAKPSILCRKATLPSKQTKSCSMRLRSRSGLATEQLMKKDGKKSRINRPIDRKIIKLKLRRRRTESEDDERPLKYFKNKPKKNVEASPELPKIPAQTPDTRKKSQSPQKGVRAIDKQLPTRSAKGPSSEIRKRPARQEARPSGNEDVSIPGPSRVSNRRMRTQGLKKRKINSDTITQSEVVPKRPIQKVVVPVTSSSDVVKAVCTSEKKGIPSILVETTNEAELVISHRPDKNKGPLVLADPIIEAESSSSVKNDVPFVVADEINKVESDSTLVNKGTVPQGDSILEDINSAAEPQREKSKVNDTVPLEAIVIDKSGSASNAALEEDDIILVSAPNEFYGRTGISKWIDSTVKPSAIAKCPLNSYLNIRDIPFAATNVRDKLCNACGWCRIFFKIDSLTKLLKCPLTPSKDVYEFDAEREATESRPSSYRKRGDNRYTESLSVSSSKQYQYRYFDLLTPHLHYLKVWFEVIGATRTIVKAHLVPRPEGVQTENLYLAENEPLVDNLIHFMTDAITKPVEKPIPSPSKPNKGSLNKSTKAPIKNAKGALPKSLTPGEVVEAPTYHLSEEEFNDPIAFFESLMPIAAKFGICKVVPPASFKPTCVLSNETKFKVSNQYIGRLYSRWGPAAREMTAIKAYLATQNVQFARAPLREGLELNLQKLYHTVQRNGGLEQVIEQKRWSRVAQEMKLAKGANPEKTLDQIYCKYLLPYDILSSQERLQILKSVDKCWTKKYQKLLEWARNPLHRQKKLLGESESESSEEEEEEDEPPGVVDALYQAEDCVMQGRLMNLPAFKRVADKAMEVHMMHIPEPAAPTPRAVETEYWRTVLLGTEHVCVNAASIGTRDSGYGFSKDEADPFGKHPWNLKMLSKNPLNVLSSLGAVLGVTVPTFHLGMIFSTSCWHRDPHMLPWVEYMHNGPPKIWYGIPNEQSSNFRKAVETLCPTSRQNKSVWLPSDITMIPPNLLREHHVSLARVEQKPGEYILVFPMAYSCSISTGYTESESVYFATKSWLMTMQQVFQEVRDSCEPTTFSLEQLLIAMARDPSVTLAALHQVHAILSTIVNEELANRVKLTSLGIQSRTNFQAKKRSGAWDVREQDECEICRTTLYLSKVNGIISRRSSLCLHHAVHLLQTRYKDADVTEVELLVSFTERRLLDIMSAVQKRLSL